MSHHLGAFDPRAPLSHGSLVPPADLELAMGLYPDPLVGWGGDTPPQSPPHWAPSAIECKGPPTEWYGPHRPHRVLGPPNLHFNHCSVGFAPASPVVSFKNLVTNNRSVSYVNFSL